MRGILNKIISIALTLLLTLPVSPITLIAQAEDEPNPVLSDAIAYMVLKSNKETDLEAGLVKVVLEKRLRDHGLENPTFAMNPEGFSIKGTMRMSAEDSYTKLISLFGNPSEGLAINITPNSSLSATVGGPWVEIFIILTRTWLVRQITFLHFKAQYPDLEPYYDKDDK